MLSLSNPASIDFFIRGETRRSMSQHARSRQANFLGLWVSPMVYGPFEGLYARNEYRFDPSDLAEMIKNPQVIEAMRRNFTEAEAQKDLMPMTQALLCCRYHPVTFNQLDLDGQDRAESEWGHYLISLAERGFRAREFHVEGSYQVLNTVFKAPFPASMGSCFYSPIIFPNHAYRASLFAAVEVSPAFEDEYLCTFASHLAARSNCPEILKLLKAMGANFMLQDHLKYSTGLSGLTAFHHAAHGLADRALAHLLYEEKPDLKALLDTEGNTILHALACSVSTTAAGKAQQLAVFDIIETALRMPVFARHALLEDAAPMPVADRAIASSPFKGIEDFYQIKNKAGKTALKVAEESKNLALIARLLTVPGADPREIDAHAAGVDLSKVYGLAIAALDTQVSLVQQKTVALSDGIARLTQNLIEHLERLQIKMARQDEAHARELACVHQRLDAVVMMMGMMATTLQERGALPKDFMGRMAQVMREGMAHSAAEPDLLGLHPQADF